MKIGTGKDNHDFYWSQRKKKHCIRCKNFSGDNCLCDTCRYKHRLRVGRDKYKLSGEKLTRFALLPRREFFKC